LFYFFFIYGICLVGYKLVLAHKVEFENIYKVSFSFGLAFETIILLCRAHY